MGLFPPSEICPYDMYRDRLPDHINKELPNYLQILSPILHERTQEVSTIIDIVALPFGRSWKFNTALNGINLIVNGSFRSNYKIIVTMAEILEDFFVETNFLPQIVPIQRNEWRKEIQNQGRIYSSLRYHGMTGFSRHLHYE